MQSFNASKRQKAGETQKSTATGHKSLWPTAVLYLEMFKIALKTALFAKK